MSELADYQSLFTTEGGRKVLLDLMARYHVGAQVHTAGDPLETAFRDGQRSVVLHLLDQIALGPEPIEQTILRAFESIYLEDSARPPEIVRGAPIDER